MIRGSIASLGLTAPRAAGPQSPAPVNAVVTLRGWQGADEQDDEAVLSATVSPAPTSTLTLTLSNGLTITIEANETEGETEAFAVNPGASAYDVSVTDWEGGGYDNVDLTNAVAQVAPHEVHAVLTLADHDGIAGATAATIAASLSHPVYGEALVITLDNGATITIPVGETEGVSTAFAVEPGGETFDVAVESVSGGTYTSLDTTDTATVTPGEPAEMVLTYLGSSIQSVSGSISKEDLLAFVPEGIDPSLVVVDCEAVGGGACGMRGSDNFGKGGAPGSVAVQRVAYAELPDEISFVVGAGGAFSNGVANSGGSTTITGIISAAGGDVALAVSPKDRPIGPGAGAAYSAYGDEEGSRGGASNDSIPELRLPGGAGRVSRPDSNGKDATNPFQHGSAGGSHVQHGGHGGWPGGGGGHSSGTGWSPGAGGGGVVRFHVYAYVPESEA